MYSNNDWRSFQHSWGKKPEQKKREREYNHQYWIDHKEEIMRKRRAKKGGSSEDYEKNRAALEEARKNRGDEDYSREAAKSVEDLYKMVDGDVDLLEKLIKMNEKTGGYADAVMDNIRQHNQNIIDNITALSDAAEKHIKSNNLSGDAAKAYLENISKQINKALDQALDLRDDSTHDYLGGKKKKSGGGSSSSSRSSNSSNSSNVSDSSDSSNTTRSTPNTGNNSTSSNRRDESQYYTVMKEANKKKIEARKKLKHGLEYFDEYYLAHHGREGQRWGERNGPPYPLDRETVASIYGGDVIKKTNKYVSEKISDGRKKYKEYRIESARRKAEKAEEERNKEKQRIINSGDPKLVRESYTKLSNSELEAALKRLDLSKRLKDYENGLSPEKTDKAKTPTIKQLVNKANTVNQTLTTGRNLWNTIATIHNTYSDDPWTVIDGTFYKGQMQKRQAEREAAKENEKKKE